MQGNICVDSLLFPIRFEELVDVVGFRLTERPTSTEIVSGWVWTGASPIPIGIEVAIEIDTQIKSVWLPILAPETILFEGVAITVGIDNREEEPIEVIG